MMRNFEEQKAEIFRRSQERIRKKARIKNAVLSAGISCLVCLVAVWGLTENAQQKRADSTIQAPMLAGQSADATTQLWVVDRGTRQAITDPETVEYLLQDILDMPALAFGQAAMDGYSSASSENCRLPEEPREFTLTVEDGAGNTAQYVFRGTTVTDTVTGNQKTLTQSQYETVLALLNIPTEEGKENEP